MVKAGKRGTVEYTELEKEPNDEKEEAKNFNNRISFYSTLLFSWLSKTLSLGYKRPLEMNDLPYYAGQEPSREIADTFEKTWSCEIKNSLSENRPPKLWTTVMRSIGYWNLTLVFFTAALAAACRVIQQLLLIYILTLMAAGTRGVNLWLFTGGFIMSLFVEMVVKNQYFYFAQLHLRATTTSGLITLVYQKVSRGRIHKI